MTQEQSTRRADGGRLRRMSRRVGVLCALLLLSPGCGPKSIEARTRLAEKHSDQAAEALDRAQKAADALEPDALDEALADAKGALSDPDINLYPESGMQQDRYAELVAKQAQVRAAREKKDLEAKLDAARSELVPLVQALLDAADGLTPVNATAARIEAAQAAAGKLKERVQDDDALFAKSPDFKDWADHQVRKAEKALEVAARAKKGVAFREGAVASYLDAKAKAAKAKKTKAPDERVAQYDGAAQQAKACVTGAKAADLDQDLSALAFPVDKKALTPQKLQKACADLARALAAPLKQARAQAAKAAKKPKKK